jgi:ubiquinone/menaquinone biosynthesis C-methylase UbiE
MKRLLLCLLLLPFQACASSKTPAGTQTPAAPLETSVRPGANERFLAPDMQVEEFVAIFEGESREIAAQREAIVAALELKPGMAVADVGAGTGLFLEPLDREVGPKGRVYAVDIAPKFVEHLRSRVAREGREGVEVVLCSERSVELPKRSLDMALVVDTYHHFEYPRSTLASIKSALRPGGKLVVVDFERIEGVSREWTLEHVRAGKDVVQAEIEAAGFELVREAEIARLAENYVLVFRRP